MSERTHLLLAHDVLAFQQRPGLTYQGTTVSSGEGSPAVVVSELPLARKALRSLSKKVACSPAATDHVEQTKN